MEVQNVKIDVSSGKMSLKWTIMRPCKAVAISVGHDIDFIRNHRRFILPATESATIDIGSGSWYVRVGVLYGEETSGRLKWSGIYGPAFIGGNKPIITEQAPRITAIHVAPIASGLRIHTGTPAPNYVLIDYSTQWNLPASQTETTYVTNTLTGHVDCLGLNYNLKYTVRLSTWSGDMTKMPIDSIEQVQKGQPIRNKVAARPVKNFVNGEQTARLEEQGMLRDVKENPRHRFTSQTDYARYLAAKERVGENVRSK